MATETFVSRQLRINYQNGFDAKGFPIIKRKAFSNIEMNASSDQLITVAEVIADLQELPLISIEHQELQNLAD